MKLQKLAYYSQVWSLVWLRAPLFTEHFEAWAQGPVAPALFQAEKYGPPLAVGDRPLAVEQIQVVTEIVRAYGARSGDWLSQLTHRERPWTDARAGLPDSAESDRRITNEAMLRYYGASPWGTDKRLSDAYLRGLDLLTELPLDEIKLLNESSDMAGESYVKWLETGE